MPSRSIDNCARVNDTAPVVAWGHTKRPRSNLFWKRHRPSPSNHKSLIRSPRFPLNTNTCPENGACSSTVSTMEERPWKPRRRSVSPAEIQIRVPGLRSINAGGSPAPHAPGQDQRRPPHSRVLGQVTRCESSPKVAWAQAPMQLPAQQRCAVLPQQSQAEASPAVASPPSRRRSYARIATGTPGSRLPRSLAQPVQSKHLEQVSPRQCAASRQRYGEPVSKSHLQQLESFRSQRHRRTDPRLLSTR